MLLENNEVTMKLFKCFFIFILSFGLLMTFSAGFADDNGQMDYIPQVDAPSDPLIVYNRFMFTINDNLDKYAVKPLAEFYNKIIPRPLNTGIDNFFYNVDGTKDILNDLLQANFYQATRDSWRFVVDTTAGVGGMFDIGERIGLPYEANGFGLTLAKWGYKNSTFFVLPLFGPSTIRDAVSMPLDYYSTPFPYVANIDIRNSLFGVDLLDRRAVLLRFQDVYDEMAIDPYVFQRNAFLQRRTYLIGRTKKLNNPYTAENTQELHRNYYLNE